MIYTQDQMTAAVARVMRGQVAKDVAHDCKIPYRSLMRKVGLAKRGVLVDNQRRGPPPALPMEIECDLVDWIVGRQIQGYPANRSEVIKKATKLYNVLSSGTLTDGWYRRFIARHPQLANRQAQVVCRVRNQISDDLVVTMYNTMLDVVRTHGLTATRLYNMDETGFYTRQKSTRVLALKGSSNVWTHDAPPSFHLTIVACGNAAGAYIAPTFVLAGQRLHRDLWDLLTVPGAQITCTASGFMNMALFIAWLGQFNASIPSNVSRPILLIIDGCSSHYSKQIVYEACNLGIILKCLPANATHLFQPLDVAVFGPLKKTIKAKLRAFVNDHGLVTVDKPMAIAIGCESWNENACRPHIAAGFRTAGLFPPSLPAMRDRLRIYKDNGVKHKAAKADWLVHREFMRNDVLFLPPKRDPKPRKRKTIDVAGKLLTIELLEQIEAEEAAAATAKQAKKRKKNNEQQEREEALV